MGRAQVKGAKLSGSLASGLGYPFRHQGFPRPPRTRTKRLADGGFFPGHDGPYHRLLTT